jgi:hypothetical protein
MENPKWFLLIAGDFYEGYKHIATFATIEEAEASVTTVTPNPDSKDIFLNYIIFECYYDYFNIIDLRNYVFGEINHESGCHKI